MNIACMAGTRKFSVVHIELMNLCPSLHTIKFIMCMPLWNPKVLTARGLKEFCDFDNLLDNRTLKKVVFDVPTTHRSLEPAFLDFVGEPEYEFVRRNVQKVEMVVEWRRT